MFRRAGLCKLWDLRGLAESDVVECLQLAVASSHWHPVGDDCDQTVGHFVFLVRGLPDPAQVVDEQAMRAVVRQAFSGLPRREALVLELRSGFGTDDHR